MPCSHRTYSTAEPITREFLAPTLIFSDNLLKLTLRSAAGPIIFLSCLSNPRAICWCVLSGLQHRDDLGSEAALPLTSWVATDTQASVSSSTKRTD